jgi:hypothetical protein
MRKIYNIFDSKVHNQPKQTSKKNYILKILSTFAPAVADNSNYTPINEDI